MIEEPFVPYRDKMIWVSGFDVSGYFSSPFSNSTCWTFTWWWKTITSGSFGMKVSIYALELICEVQGGEYKRQIRQERADVAYYVDGEQSAYHPIRME